MKVTLLLLVISVYLCAEAQLGVRVLKTNLDSSDSSLRSHIVSLQLGLRKYKFSYDNKLMKTKLFIKKTQEISSFLSNKPNNEEKSIQEEDTLFFNREKINNFKFEVENSESSGIDGVLSLNLNSQDSLVNILYQRKIITKRIFAQKFMGDIAFLQFGENSELNNPSYTSCKSIHNTGCVMTGISVGNYSRNLKGIAVFDLSKEFISFPASESKFFISKIFNKFLRIKDCSLEDKRILCNRQVNIESVSFIFDGVAYNIQAEKLFKKINDKFEFIIRFDNKDDNYSFGQLFNSNFHMIFDGENNEIGFYAGNKINLNKSNQNQNLVEDLELENLLVESDESGEMFILLFIGIVLTLALGLIFYLCFTEDKEDIEYVKESNSNPIKPVQVKPKKFMMKIQDAFNYSNSF